MNMKNLNELLLTVQKPARYTGGEWNSVKKPWDDDKVKVLLAFPDLYEVGMSYLGLKILYGILNGRKDCLAERVFSPWNDFEDVLRKNGISLFSLESRRPLKEFDIIGISLAYELSYTNVLNILDLGGIPKRVSERTDSDPVVIAGGPSCYNPEPMAEFIDAFLIGDGEDAVGDIVDVYKECRVRASADKVNKKEFLRRIAAIEGVYVPSLYRTEYKDDLTIKAFGPNEAGMPPVIKKRIVKDLNASFYPVRQIVPYIEIVHDRIALEIMRGCKHACRFCQAGSTYRPSRERSMNKVLELAGESYAATGYDEISLLSLSSGDHSQILNIIEGLNRSFAGRAVSISVPSLRVEDILKSIPMLVSHVKKTGLTFAPEAGSECLRRAINKNINIEKLFEALKESFRAGWGRVKLYFMIGLPGETESDLKAMIELLYKISDLKRETDGKSAHVTASINAFVPKPHTPFQWKCMESIEELENKKSFLRSGIKSRMIELDFHSFEMSYLEGVFSRGDRRLSEVIYDAWQSGLRFDGWKEFFDITRWRKSFDNARSDAGFYVMRTRRGDEILPWDFIDLGIKKDVFLKEAQSCLPWNSQ